MVRIDWVGIVGCANSECPGQCSGHLPGVLRIEVQVEEVVGLGIGQRERFRGGGCHSINELRQGRIVNQWNRPLSEVIVIQPEDPGVRPKPQFVRTDTPRQIVIDKESGGAPALHPSIVESADCRKRRIRSAALQHDRERVERLLKITRTE